MRLGVRRGALSRRWWGGAGRTLTASMKRLEGSDSSAHVRVFFFAYLRWSLTSSQLTAAAATFSVVNGSLLN